jgi:osmotically-inducible protein OsmY
MERRPALAPIRKNPERSEQFMIARMTPFADSDLSRAVLSQIRQNPKLAKTDVHVQVDGGVVTLSGLVDSSSQRDAIEAAAKDVWGVHAIANDLMVKPREERTDTEIARDVLAAFASQLCIPTENITVIVRDGNVSLEGKVHWEFQKMLTEASVKRLPGIKRVLNNVVVESGRATEEMTREMEMRAGQAGLKAPNGLSSENNGTEYNETGEPEAG